MTPQAPLSAARREPGRQAYVSATVVQVERPTSARPGDAAVVHADGRIDGFVGGVCAESTVRLHALRALETGEPVLLRVVPGEAETMPDGEGTVTVRNPCLSGGALQIFLQPHLPPRRVTVYGGSPIARAVADLSRRLGDEVTEAEDADGEIPAETSVVVVASLGRVDEQALLRAVSAGVPYIGLVASPTRGAAILASLELSATDQARVHSPAGLDIGARTPHEVAISILAELIALRAAARTAGSRRPGPQADAGAVVATPPETVAPAAGAGSVATAIDPVCGMTVAAIDVTLHRDHDGAVVWFCSDGCMKAFEQDRWRGGVREPDRIPT